ncbi:Hsp20/alpha crystallin family protein [Caballeronia sp. BR00000012568055]|uniref:Hsp20/alpha crystallin family protein n=1 Tax=Caballeronia sp. BR00000012568055 TaxID=2918761 RepID=UPI0023F9FC23|nr:Hsp20/alpha crystallin family protein [Caballeronia sp. BR00000012568055]
MSSLTRFDPFSIEPVSEMFQGLFRPLRGLSLEESSLGQVKIDVSETDASYQVKAELPGIEKKDINVKLDRNTVSIHAKSERNKEVKDGERLIRRERYAGEVSRTFSLGSEIDEAGASAQYQDGILTLTLPKKAPADQKRLQIN